MNFLRITKNVIGTLQERRLVLPVGRRPSHWTDKARAQADLQNCVAFLHSEKTPWDLTREDNLAAFARWHQRVTEELNETEIPISVAAAWKLSRRLYLDQRATNPNDLSAFRSYLTTLGNFISQDLVPLASTNPALAFSKQA